MADDEKHFLIGLEHTRMLHEFGAALKTLVDKFIREGYLHDPWEIYYLAFRRIVRTPNYARTIFLSQPQESPFSEAEQYVADSGPMLIFDPATGALCWSYLMRYQELPVAEQAILFSPHVQLDHNGSLLGYFDKEGEYYLIGGQAPFPYKSPI